MEEVETLENGDVAVMVDEVPVAEPIYSDDDPNLVSVLLQTESGRKWLKEATDKVVKNYDADMDGSKELREQRARDYKVFVGDLPPKQYPFQNCSNAHVPIMLENISRLSFRTEAEMFGDGRAFFDLRAPTPDLQASAEVAAQHANWQLNEKYPDFRRQMARAILTFLMNSSVVAHSYYDTDLRRPIHETLTDDDFVMPYVYVTTMPDLSDLPHYTRVLCYYDFQLEKMRGQWVDVDKVLEKKAPSFSEDPEEELRDARAEVEKKEATEDTEAPYRLLQYYGWFKLPGRTEHNWMQFVVDRRTRVALSARVFEEADKLEEYRFERQTDELRTYKGQRDARLQQMIQVEQAKMQAQQVALLDPMAAEQMAMSAQQAEAMLPPEPMKPAWVKSVGEPEDPTPPKRRPIHMFSHGVCIEGLVGNSGLSYGRIQADYNRAADTMLSQFID